MSSPALRIAEVAGRAGVTTATVRYYERIGVLPPAPRASNGYRRYDERTVERLAFITRAKQLGCTLDEIADLTHAWDGGTCGPIRDRLRAVVADKVARAQTEIVELVTLTGQLRRAAAALERHRPAGACDERCGCVTDPLDAAPHERSVALAARPSGGAEPVACTLSPDRMRDRLHDWNRLLHERAGRRGAVRCTAIDCGVRLELGDTIEVAELAQLAAAEHDCCRFFSFAITIDHRGLGLEVTAPPDALAAVTALFGAPS